MEVGTVVHVFVRDVADHQKCAECAKKLYDYQYIVAADSRSYSSDLAKIRGAAPILKEIIKLCTELTFEQLKFIKHLRKCYIC